MYTRILILLAIISSSLLRADVLTYTVTPNAGQFWYQFTLTNTGATGGALFDLFLALQTDITNIDTVTIGAPAGWGDLTGGLVIFGPDISPSTSFIDWSADFSTLYDLATGSSLPGFSFKSSIQINQPIAFAVNGSTDFATAQEVSSVPEPATVVLVLPVIAVILFRARFISKTAAN